MSMTKRQCAVICLLVCSWIIGAATLRAAQKEVLDNGLVRLTFDQQTGLFAAHALGGGVLDLVDAGPRFAVDGHEVLAHEATNVRVRRESFEDRLGKGNRLVVNYSFGVNVPSFRYELRLYSGKPWISVTAFLPRGDYQLGDFSLVEGRVTALSAFKTRVYVNSGTAGGDSGVWPLGLMQWDSAALSVLYEPKVQDAMGLGFYSFYRASTSVTSRYLTPNEIGVNAVAHYYDYRPEDGELRTESALLSFGRNPLVMLDDWADAAVKTVQPKFNHDTRTGLLEAWYIYGDRITEDDLLEQARLLRKSILPGYGINLIFTGEWQKQRSQPGDTADHYGFGADQEDRRLFPHEVKWLSEQLQSLGFKTNFGANYAYAAPESRIAREHAPWIIWVDHSRSEYGYPIDFTSPGAQAWLRNLAHRAVEYKASEWWDDFDGGPTRGKLHDPTKIMQFEDIREGLKVIRREVGPDVLIHRYCCGPYFTYIGLADRVRIADDSHALGDFAGLKAMARQFAANYMLHQRFWINDADPIFVGGRNNRDPGAKPDGFDPATLDAVRMRLQEEVITGSYITIGENLADFDQERMHLLTLVLPSYGQAARPLDLFIHTTPERYDLKVRTGWDAWDVLLLQNWNDEDKAYRISFSRLGLDGNKNYLVFRFWDQRFLGEHRGVVKLDVGGRQGQAYAIRSVPQHPWVLSTDMHLTQGGVELHSVRYNNSTQQLSGIATRHPGDRAHVVIYVPEGYKVRSGSGVYQTEPQSSGANVVYLQLRFQTAAAPWFLDFERTR